MIGWAALSTLFTPRQWFGWLWAAADEGAPANGIDDGYLIARDMCAKCNRFLSWHSTNNTYCSFHNVTWATSTADKKTTPYQLFKNTFEMWLRSRCGGDMDEGLISTNLLTLSSYLDFAATHSETNGNPYDFCDIVFCDYQMVYDFLVDLRLQAKNGNGNGLMLERHTVDTEMRICEALHRFIEFRKFQLPVKGIVENRYSATERILDTYRGLLTSNQPVAVSLFSQAITRADITATINHFVPQYDIIINYFEQCRNVRSMENGCDIEFATSFLCAYLYSIMPSHVDYLHMVRVRDLHLQPDLSVESADRKHISTELTQYVSSSSYDLPSPIIASACINKLQKCLTLDEKTRAIVNSYVTFIRPRITKSNDYLLLNSSALGLTATDVQEKIITLVYRVAGKVTYLVDRLEREEPTTPALPRLKKGGHAMPRLATQPLKKVRFGRTVFKKVSKRHSRNKFKMRRKLTIDLSGILK